jgi:Fcf2 pre-rRNA processing
MTNFQLKKKTAGPDWFDLPAPAEADLPRLYREVEALRLRNHLDPKRFYKKDEGEGKGIKGLPTHFAVSGSPCHYSNIIFKLTLSRLEQ